MFVCALFMSFSSADCSSYSGALERISKTGDATVCIVVINGVFSSLSGQRLGGAIYLGSNCGPNNVTDTSIIFCSAIEDGGAIAHGGAALCILRCCIRSTTAASRGTAIDCWQLTNQKSISH
jgi:hypothetical protein